MTSGSVLPESAPRAASKGICLWCGRPFSVRRGGSPKRFCSAAHRTAFWSALRRWGERAVAAGILTVGDIRNSAAAACTLQLGSNSPVAISLAQKPAPVAPAESTDEAGELCSTSC